MFLLTNDNLSKCMFALSSDVFSLFKLLSFFQTKGCIHHVLQTNHYFFIVAYMNSIATELKISHSYTIHDVLVGCMTT